MEIMMLCSAWLTNACAINMKLATRKFNVHPVIDWSKVDEINPKELKSLYAQWSRFYVIGNNFNREYIVDEDVTYQYVVPRSQRLPVLEHAHDLKCLGTYV